MKIHKIDLVLDHSKFKKKFTQIVLTYQARSTLEDESFRKQYNTVLKRNAEIKGEEIPIFDEDFESGDSLESQTVKKESEEMKELTRQI